MMTEAATARRRGSARLIWVLSFFAISFAIWAHNAPLDEIVRGPGTLVPASNAQIVQSLEGGILEEINVSEGDLVETGQIIARLNETRYRADVRDYEGQILAIEAELLRLQAEIDLQDSFTLPARFHTETPDLARSEHQLFQARLQSHLTALSAAQDQANQKAQQVELIRNLVDQGAVPALDLIEAEIAASEAQAAADRLEADYQLERAQRVSELLTELGRLNAQVEQSRDQLDRSTLLSPADGIVNTLYTTTIGGVVQSGEPIFEITPLNDDLLVEVRIRPEDIAFVATGMPTTIKLTAYDYTVYGTLSGRVAQISADTFEDDQSPERQPYYKVLVEVAPESLADRADVFEIRPGMVAEAELHVGERTVMQYLITPLIKSSEALREP